MKSPWLYVAIAGAGFWYYSHNRVTLTTEGTKSADPYEIHPNTATAFGIGQNAGVGPVPPSHPSNPFDALYQAGTQDTVQGRYSNGLFQNLNLTQKMLGLPFFTGECGPNCVKVYDPKKNIGYNWNPETNTVVSGNG